MIDDASTDGTINILKEKIEPLVDTIIYHPKNNGKGALRTGFIHANGDIVVVQDADLEYDPNELHLLMEPILKGDADVV